MFIRFVFFFLCLGSLFAGEDRLQLGVDLFFKEGHAKTLKGKKVGLITNHTGVDSSLQTTYDLFLHNKEGMILSAVFTPEHGLLGHAYAYESCHSQKVHGSLPVHSLFGKTRRPTEAMLKGIDVLIYDIQDIGCRSYTYATTLFYVMEEAAKKHIPLYVLDRPNPIGGEVVDGPMLEEKWRSFIGYINVPYCHGMTIGELALFFNTEYQIGCSLKVISMKGWSRKMRFADTKLTWIPTSPQIPEPDTPLFYATTGVIGELSIVNIGVGYTLPFKIIGAPWIHGKVFAEKLNAQKLSGVQFVPFHFKPQYGLYKGEHCQGVLITITDKERFYPVKVQHLILGTLKAMYPQIVGPKIANLPKDKKRAFCLSCGTEEIFSILTQEKYATWKLFQCYRPEREQFLERRKKFLLYN